ncbi:serine hydrolase [Fimbriiglobus ruber]|uniref:Beta-lactamase n=1 Tax=Fimbriiglobus ruber TaxID=1908690 RepID=A0A225E0F0_9BACT|nr:serine hydrolase [Fimbriiglobus ruber]OWK47042.1 Beta-lactamase [Fimbriiglobus ruber]
MTRTAIILSTCTLLFLSHPLAHAADDRKPLDETAVDRVALGALLKWEAPGLAVVIVRGGETVYLKGFGVKSVESKIPVTPDTLFPLASCSKAFTTTLMARMVDEGVIAWDDPVRTHLPNFHLSDPVADAQVTLRDLVTHRTGLGGHDYLWYRAPWKLDEVLRRAARLPLSAPFRGSYQYSSIPFMAAGRAVANRADTPWNELLREKVCDPIGMKGVALTSAEAAVKADRATGHRHTPAGAIEVMPLYEIAEPNPAGSVFATPNDLAAWLKFQLADGLAGGKRIVSAANLNETKTPQTVMRKDETIGPVYPDSVQVSYAMGWVVYDHRGKHVVAHGGVIDGFRTQITLLPDEKIGIALVNNLHQTKMNIAIGNTLIDQLLGLPPKDWNAYFLKVEWEEQEARRAARAAREKAHVLGTKASAPLAAYAGEYEDAAYGTAKVTVAEGHLVWEWSSFRCRLEHYQQDVFRVTGGHFDDQLIAFQVNDGVPVALKAIDVIFVRK